jgi:hypothetical protein
VAALMYHFSPLSCRYNSAKNKCITQYHTSYLHEVKYHWQHYLYNLSCDIWKGLAFLYSKVGVRKINFCVGVKISSENKGMWELLWNKEDKEKGNVCEGCKGI